MFFQNRLSQRAMGQRFAQIHDLAILVITHAPVVSFLILAFLHAPDPAHGTIPFRQPRLGSHPAIGQHRFDRQR